MSETAKPRRTLRSHLKARDGIRLGLPPRDHGTGRYCRVCNQPLVRFNKGPNCYLHTDRVPPKRLTHGIKRGEAA